MENIKCKIKATNTQLEEIGIDYHLTGIVGYIQKDYGTGYYAVKIPNYRINYWIVNDIIVDIPKYLVKVYKPGLENVNIYVDMDNVLCDYVKGKKKALDANPKIHYPQSQYGFFANLEVIPNQFAYLNKFFNVRILTSPSARNPMCYTEKRVWIEKHLGIEVALDMMIVPDKSAVGTENDYLIDDIAQHERSKQQDFRGTLIHYGSEEFPDWSAVAKFFDEKYNLNEHESVS